MAKKHTKTETSANSNKCEKRKTDEETDRRTDRQMDHWLYAVYEWDVFKF